MRLLKRIVSQRHVEVIHLNHDSLFVVGLISRMMFGKKIVLHVRTMLPPNRWAKVQMFISLKVADYLVFITENERELWFSTWKKLRCVPNTVVHNIAQVNPELPARILGSDLFDKFKVLSLMTFTFLRGVDRLVDVALALRERKCANVVFVICGQSDDAIYERRVKRRIEELNLGGYFRFFGYQKNPEALLSEVDALIRPSREDNPWGRDVIEALACGKPVLAFGKYDKFVENGINGFLWSHFDPDKVAEKITFLTTHPEIIESIRNANLEKAQILFDGQTNAKKISAIYESLVGTACSPASD
jgi:glycosyltransferase involved in cell wall biosynthesis